MRQSINTPCLFPALTLLPIYSSTHLRSFLLEQRLDEIPGVKLAQVIQFFPDANVAQRNF
jgi:hypothetical protein